MPPNFSEDDSELVSKLHSLSKKSPRLVRSSTYPAPTDPNIHIRSWKMNEFKYYQIPSPFPTLARGLFTTQFSAPDDDSENRHRIIVRGYDKFFNIGEVPWCTWSALAQHTAAPYTLSLKSNGCIIFIAALTPTNLLVTSKHSLGPLQATPLSHAEAGQKWLYKHLNQKNRTEQQLASHLWENNWTAIAELCDDSFEEHVLPYPPEKTGLHLHGLNESTKDFNTLPHNRVDDFAEEWGFIKTPTLTFNSIDQVRSFTEKIGLTGKWNDEAVEGFVVRTHVTEPPTKSQTTSPYTPGSSLFFKVKFDEPYMMYRDWRELTKSLLSPKSSLSASALSKSKMKRPETKLYVNWVIGEIKRDRSQFEDYAKGKGIIATRERFLQWLSTKQGKENLDTVISTTDDTVTVEDTKDFQKTIIVPVAIPGCGKTSVSVALAHIFGFGHTQSDDVHAKKAAPHFLKNVASYLKNYDVVIADKNNHLRQHREALRDVAADEDTPTRLLALDWAVSEKPQATVHRVCGDRVARRGDNHQTLRADKSGSKAHEDVIWGFINSSQELTRNEVDAVVEMDMEDDLARAVRKAADGVVRVLGVQRPTEDKIAEALKIVESYAPSVKKPDEPPKKGKNGHTRYYALLPELDLEAMLEEQLKATDSDPDNPDFELTKATEMFRTLDGNKRTVKLPHVTIVHAKSTSSSEEKDLWDKCVELSSVGGSPSFRMRLGHLVWSDRVMAMTVDVFDVCGEGDGVDLGRDWLRGLPDELKARLHITVGTRDNQVPQVEGKELIERWQKDDDASRMKYSLELRQVELLGRLKGLT